MRLASRLSRIKPSATLAVNAKSLELKAQGRAITSLAVGETDFPTPDHVRAAAKAAIDQGFTRYTPVPGIPELREAVAAYFNGFYGTHAKAEHCIVTNGGKQALYNLFQALLDEGDEVLIPAPYWVSYPAMVMLADGEPVAVPTQAADGFKVTPAQLEAARTDRTRILILNSPSNPTGAHYSREELDALAAWAVQAGVFVISDEIYDRLVYAPAEPLSLAPWWEKHPEGFCVVNGLAKSFSMTGWRVGYALACEDLVKALSKIQGQSTSNVCSIAQKAALAALTGGFGCLEPMLAAFARRRDLVLEELAAWPDVVCPEPAGAFYVFPDVSAHYREGMADSAQCCTRLLEEAGVAAVPGAAFGDDRCIRLSYALNESTLSAALKAVRSVLIP